ncbi:unnamed protein product [Zymoseptoria tritici ST99CH_3D7]|uniref:Ig-like domain-containing protein n=1 Tax=Zymoseptoria tritici (strain ST99CH_3D7) TaxID=1276538 RepID=A0A1X7SAD8_ZYMT9|nr:unnamed protein product [Zymoseptoria tritici ST99CH_3D7]
MRGFLIIAITSLLSSVSATCILPDDASLNNPDPAKRLTSNPPTGLPGSRCAMGYSHPGNHPYYLYWRCAYGPDLSSLNCHNDYNRGVGDPVKHPLRGAPCHFDTNTNPPENNGQWQCVAH